MKNGWILIKTLKTIPSLKKNQIDVTAQADVDIPLQWVKEIGCKVLQGENHNPENFVSVILVDQLFITQMNRDYFQIDAPTDVISFVLSNDIFPGEEESAWGEVYVSVEQAREQAREYQVSYQEELARLVIHGILHLLGFDDQTQQDKMHMTKKEDFYLSQMRSE